MKKNLLVCVVMVLALNMKAQTSVEKIIGEYPGTLNVSMVSAEDPTVVTPFPASESKIIIEAVDALKINFKLNNLVLGGEMLVGNVKLEDVEIVEGTPIVIKTKQNIKITAGDPGFILDEKPVPIDGWIGPDITGVCGGTIPVDLDATVTREGLKDVLAVKINIDISAAMGYNVVVTFNGEKPVGGSSVRNESMNSVDIRVDANGELTVSGLDKEVPYTIYGINGAAILKGVTSGTITQTSALDKGIYLIKMTNVVSKFVKR